MGFSPVACLTYQRGVLQAKLVELFSSHNSKVLSQTNTAARFLCLKLLGKVQEHIKWLKIMLLIWKKRKRWKSHKIISKLFWSSYYCLTSYLSDAEFFELSIVLHHQDSVIKASHQIEAFIHSLDLKHSTANQGGDFVVSDMFRLVAGCLVQSCLNGFSVNVDHMAVLSWKRKDLHGDMHEYTFPLSFYRIQFFFSLLIKYSIGIIRCQY